MKLIIKALNSIISQVKKRISTLENRVDGLNIPSIEGLASETYVEEKISEIDIPSRVELLEHYITIPDYRSSGVYSIEPLAVTYARGEFWCISILGVVYHSFDGINWIKNPNAIAGAAGTYWPYLLYTGDKFVAMSTDHYRRIAISYNGFDWTVHYANASFPAAPYEKPIYGNGVFVVNNPTKLAYSFDGINWVDNTSAVVDGELSNRSSLAYGDGVFVLLSPSGYAYYSENGINWTRVTAPASEYSSSSTILTHGDGKFVAVFSGTGQAVYSHDGKNWFESSITPPYSFEYYDWDWSNICYGNGRFIALMDSSHHTAYSDDGVNWTMSTISLPSYSEIRGLTYGNGRFIFVRKQGEFVYSLDGINWVFKTSEYTQDGAPLREIASKEYVNQRITPTAMYLYSEENSSKRFKITVDDSGTISATEVTP